MSPVLGLGYDVDVSCPPQACVPPGLGSVAGRPATCGPIQWTTALCKAMSGTGGSGHPQKG